MTVDQRWTLRLHPDHIKIARLAAGSTVPGWARHAGPLSSVTWNAHETSIVAPAADVPIGVDQAGPFQAFEVKGPLDFTLVGILHDLLAPLTREGVSVVTMSTFCTDWILVPVEQCTSVADVWRSAGHIIDEQTTQRSVQ